MKKEGNLRQPRPEARDSGAKEAPEFLPERLSKKVLQQAQKQQEEVAATASMRTSHTKHTH